MCNTIEEFLKNLSTLICAAFEIRRKSGRPLWIRWRPYKNPARGAQVKISQNQPPWNDLENTAVLFYFIFGPAIAKHFHQGAERNS